MGRHTRVLGTLASLSLAGGVAGYAAPAAAAAAPTSASTVSEVIVTAQRREERLQEVPVTLTVVGSDQMDRQNIATTSDLVRAVPSLTVTNLGIYQIRSIGTLGFGRGVEQSVSTVLDGVVLARAISNQMYDLDHVEVLSGPQGTLFGKNASAGVINIVTKAPVLGRYQAIGHLDAATSRDYVHGYIIGNAPLGENAALRLSYHHDSTGNIVYNTIFKKWDHNTDDGVRARLLWKPTDRLTINLSGDYQELASNGVNGVADFAGVGVLRSAPTGSRLEATLAGCGIVAGPKNNKSCANSLYDPNVPTGDTYGRWNGGGAIQIDWEFVPGLTFTSITAKRESVNEDLDVFGNLAGEFGDSLPQNLLDRNLVPFRQQIFSEEARIQSSASNPLNFVAGVYYSKSDSHDVIDQTGQFGAALGTLQFRRLINIYIEAQSYAAFGQLNWRASPKWQFLLGGRITHDDNKDLSFNSFPAGPFIYTANTGFFSVFPINSCTLAGGNPDVAGSCPAGTSLTEPAKLSKTGISWKVGAQYFANTDTMIFATLTRGYKGPSFNEAASFPVRPSQLFITSEYPLSFDLGIKTTLFDNVAVDVTAFTNLIRDFQTTVYVPPGPNNLVANFIQGNAPHVVSRGVEVNVFGALSPNFTLNGGAIYNDAHFNKGFLVACAAGPCPALHKLPYAPKFKATLSGEYHRPIAGQIEGFAQSDLAYSGSYTYGSAPGIPKSGPRTIVGARAGVRSDDGKWGVSVFCRNCFNKNYPIVAGFDGFATSDGGVAAGQPTSTTQFLSLDFYRLIGLSLDARF